MANVLARGTQSGGHSVQPSASRWHPLVNQDNRAFLPAVIFFSELQVPTCGPFISARICTVPSTAGPRSQCSMKYGKANNYGTEVEGGEGGLGTGWQL